MPLNSTESTHISPTHRHSSGGAGLAYPKKSVVLSKHQFRKLAQQAFERDGYTCQLCKIRHDKKFLHPHHIIPCGRIRIDTLENLLTVDFKCHRLLHDALLHVSVDDLIDKYGMRRYLR